MGNPVKIRAEVSSTINHGDGVYTVVLNPEKKIPKFKPGQFLHLTLDDYDPQGGFWPESRVFSIASASDQNKVCIVYSVKGKYTTRMSQDLCIGKKIWLKLPYGNFIIDSHINNEQDIILVAGGTGISPYISFLSTFAHSFQVERPKIHLMYGVRKLSLMLFRDLLSECLSSKNNFSMDIFLEEPVSQPLFSNKVIPLHGVLSFDHILKYGKQLRNPLYFLSGPPQMIKKFKINLLKCGISDTCIKIDEWE